MTYCAEGWEELIEPTVEVRQCPLCDMPTAWLVRDGIWECPECNATNDPDENEQD